MTKILSTMKRKGWGLLTALLLTQLPMAFAQTNARLEGPGGQPVKGSFSGAGFFTDNSVLYVVDDINEFLGIRVVTANWHPPFPNVIQDCAWKLKDSTYQYKTLLILLSPSGDIYELKFRLEYGSGGIANYVSTDSVKYRGRVGSTDSESFEKVVGEALYALGTSAVYVNRGSGIVWNLDTAGLGNVFVNDIALDSNQNVYAATTLGLFTQLPDTNVWVHNDHLNSGSLQTVFVDRRNRIFVGSISNGVYASKDNGNTWARDSAGMGSVSVVAWGDDGRGNIYAVSPSNAFRSRGSTDPWVRIDGGLRAATINNPVIRDIGGDSTIYASTSAGVFRSTDQGTTWAEWNNDIKAETFTAFIKSTSGRWFTSTGIGVYSKSQTDTSWTEGFPGNLGILPLYADANNNVYTTSGGLFNGASYVYKTSDNGKTWFADTVGLTRLRLGYFDVDEAGGQHLATSQYGGSFPSLLYYKSPHGAWALDTAGFRSTQYSYSSSIASDRHGYYYVSGSYYDGNTPINALVMRRRIAGGKWVPDTVGLTATSSMSHLTPDKDGNIIATNGNSLYRRANGAWSHIPLPTTLQLPFVQSISIDSSNVLFASFGVLGVARGVYYTSNLGATWTYAGLDSVGFSRLVSYGDSTFASTPGGLYVLTRQGVRATGIVGNGQTPKSFELFQNYPNPFNPTTNLGFRIAERRFVSLKIFDVLGRDIATLVDEIKPAGEYRVLWDAGKMASGIYFYRLQSGSFVETKKLVLLK